MFDTSALLDLFGRWTDDHRERRGDLIREVSLLAPLAPVLFSSHQIREEIRELLAISDNLSRYITFETVPGAEVLGIPNATATREADFSLAALSLRFERAGHRVFVLTKDRTFVRDFAGAGSKALIVPPTGLAEAITVLCAAGGRGVTLAHRLQNNTYVNLSRGMRLVKQSQGDAAYLDWQEWLNSRTAAKHELIEALMSSGIVL